MRRLGNVEHKCFQDEGYLVVNDLIDVAAYLDPLVEEYDARLDRLLDRLQSRGQVSSTFKELQFQERLAMLYKETRSDWAQYFDFSLPLARAPKLDEPCFFGSSIFNLLRNPDILDVIEDLIGSEIYSNPVQHVRLKPPERLAPDTADGALGLVTATPWHQDASTVIEEADGTAMVTVWIPIFDATETNGCLCVVPNGHRAGLLEHCPTAEGRRYLATHLFDAEHAIPVPMRRGSALFMNRMTPHCSLPNESDEIRWSMDLRYNPTGQPTGRPEFPGFVARSRNDPQSELRDPNIWKENWLTTRRRLASGRGSSSRFSRSWTGVGCA